jgi:putative membrane protein
MEPMPGMADPPSWPALLPLAGALAGYLVAMSAARRRGHHWPAEWALAWYAGLATAAFALVGPVARMAGEDMRAHMIGHLLVGMAAPLMLVAGRPVTLALRALPPAYGRGLALILRSSPLRGLTHPVTAAALDAGGLWILYTTGIYRWMSTSWWALALVHLHLLIAGYLFTASIVGRDPAPHRPGRRFRAVVLIAFLAAHGTLAKYLYGHPPGGTPAGHAPAAAMIMYYGGDLLDLILIVVFCRQWYRTGAPARDRRLWRLPADI